MQDVPVLAVRAPESAQRRRRLATPEFIQHAIDVDGNAVSSREYSPVEFLDALDSCSRLALPHLGVEQFFQS